MMLLSLNVYNLTLVYCLLFFKKEEKQLHQLVLYHFLHSYSIESNDTE